MIDAVDKVVDVLELITSTHYQNFTGFILFIDLRMTFIFDDMSLLTARRGN